jgi:hypothetical protein
MNTNTVITIVIAVLIVSAVSIWFLVRKRRSKQLRSHFGPEYDHTVRQLGSQAKAEDALAARQKYIESIRIHPLVPQVRDIFAVRWHEVQARFVDDPTGSIHDADSLVNEAMQARGYPMGEFEQRAEDLSVDHPQVVQNYRAAHAIAIRGEHGGVATEDLRRALVYYRDLFEELLELHGVR